MSQSQSVSNVVEFNKQLKLFLEKHLQISNYKESVINIILGIQLEDKEDIEGLLQTTFLLHFKQFPQKVQTALFVQLQKFIEDSSIPCAQSTCLSQPTEPTVTPSPSTINAEVEDSHGHSKSRPRRSCSPGPSQLIDRHRSTQNIGINESVADDSITSKLHESNTSRPSRSQFIGLEQHQFQQSSNLVRPIDDDDVIVTYDSEDDDITRPNANSSTIAKKSQPIVSTIAPSILKHSAPRPIAMSRKSTPIRSQSIGLSHVPLALTTIDNNMDMPSNSNMSKKQSRAGRPRIFPMQEIAIPINEEEGFFSMLKLRPHLAKNPLTAHLVDSQANNQIANTDKIHLVAVSVGRLIDLHGGIGCLDNIPQEQKHSLAAAIVSIVPSMALTDVARGVLPSYGHLYNPQNGSGYIKFRISNLFKTPAVKNTRRSLGIVDKSRKRLTWSIEDQSDFMRKKARIEHASSEQIKDVLIETFEARRQWISSTSPTITAILKDARLIEKDFVLLEQEFSLMNVCENPNALIEEWHVWSERIGTLSIYQDLGQTIASIKFLESKIVTNFREDMSIFQHINENESAIEFSKKCLMRQPYLLIQSCQESLRNLLVLDGTIYPINRTPLSSIDLLFKVHYVCNVKFQNNLLQFLASYVYRVKDGSTCPPKLLTVLSSLFNGSPL